MRMRKKKWAEPFLEENSDIVIKNPQQNCGNWKNILSKNELHLEIGCGKGDYFVNMSKLHTHTGWIAVEKDRNVAAVAAKKIKEEKCDSCCIIAFDAKDLDQWFLDNEIHTIHLNFSDPWSKNGYRKRRLSHESFLKTYKRILSPDGRIIMKTDNKKLFEFSLCEFSRCGWVIDDVWMDFRSEDHNEDVLSEYESKFVQLNLPIYRAIFKLK
ncbi:MAG: tRNA (guanosine(46)-N7)-methyltransferase TrmB [Anaerorhabdus sp.]